MPERKPYLKGNIIKPNPSSTEIYKNLVEQFDEEFKFIKEVERIADEEVKRMEIEIKKEAYKTFKEEEKEELIKYAKITAKIQYLEAISKKTGRKIGDKVLKKH